MLCRWGVSDCGRKFRLDFLPVSTRLHPQLQAGDRKPCVCMCVRVSDSGNPFANCFLISKPLLTFMCVSHYLSAHVLNQNVLSPASFLFSTSRFVLKGGAGFSVCGPVKCSTPGLYYLLVPFTHTVSLNATALCVCFCVYVLVCV